MAHTRDDATVLADDPSDVVRGDRDLIELCVPILGLFDLHRVRLFDEVLDKRLDERLEAHSVASGSDGAAASSTGAVTASSTGAAGASATGADAGIWTTDFLLMGPVVLSRNLNLSFALGRCAMYSSSTPSF